MTRTTFRDPDDEWHKLIANQPELQPLGGDITRTALLATTESSRVVVTVDGNLGLWIKLTPFQAAAWHVALQHAECPDYDENDEDLDWEDVIEQDINHDMALHFLADRLAQCVVPMRRAFLELGWDELLDGPE